MSVLTDQTNPTALCHIVTCGLAWQCCTVFIRGPKLWLEFSTRDQQVVGSTLTDCAVELFCWYSGVHLPRSPSSIEFGTSGRAVMRQSSEGNRRSRVALDVS